VSAVDDGAGRNCRNRDTSAFDLEKDIGIHVGLQPPSGLGTSMRTRAVRVSAAHFRIDEGDDTFDRLAHIGAERHDRAGAWFDIGEIASATSGDDPDLRQICDTIEFIAGTDPLGR
jgi:hypothetical protein